MKRLKLALLFVAIGFVTAAPAQAQIAVEPIASKLERDTIAIGDQVVFTIVASVPNSTKLLFPVIADTLGGGVDVIGKPTTDSVAGETSTTYTMRLLITAFDSGTVVVSGLPFMLLHLDSGSIDTLYSPQQEMFVRVIPKNPNQPDIFDIKPPLREPLTFSEVAPWVGLGLLLIAAVVLLILYLKKRKENKPFLKIFKPAEPAHIIALRELNVVKEQKMWTGSNHKFYYTKLTDILRAYIEGRFGVDAQEKTSTEILADLRNVDFNFGSQFPQLEDMLLTADLVKFAKHAPSGAEGEQYLNFSIDFVNSTKPDEKPEVKTDGSDGDGEDAEIAKEPTTDGE